MKLLSIGFGNVVAAHRIIAVVSPDAAPIRRLVADAKARHLCIDATGGRKTQAVLVMDSGHVVLAYQVPEKLVLANGKNIEYTSLNKE